MSRSVTVRRVGPPGRMVFVLQVALVLGGAWATGCRAKHSVPDAGGAPAIPPVQVEASLLERFAPVSAGSAGQSNPSDALVALGRQLFFDQRLSKSGKVACQSCHDLARFGVGSRKTEDAGSPSAFDIPTVYNVGFSTLFGWKGQHRDLAAFLGAHLPEALGAASLGEVSARLGSIEGYRAALAKGAGQSDEAKVVGALVEFLRTLVTPSRFDAFLRGDASALTELEKRGLVLFRDEGCISCHSGAALGGDAVEPSGKMRPYGGASAPGEKPSAEGPPKYRVPGLRNVGKTAPYMHDGAVQDLTGAVEVSFWTQRSAFASESTVAALVAFLQSLSGDVQRQAAEMPGLP